MQTILKKIDDYRFLLPQAYQSGMRVDGVVYSKEKMLPDIVSDKALEQVANVATLPGIVGKSLAMPDIHWGYGFPIGGVAATSFEHDGVVSPGGVGFDINCGVRLMRTELTFDEIRDKQKKLVDTLFNDIPTGVGSSGSIVLSRNEFRKMLGAGVRWAEDRGMAESSDISHCEEEGSLAGAEPDAVSDRAYARGKDQLGTLGSGNHFLEVQEVIEVFDEAVAAQMGIRLGQITVMIHSGSRGFGHQVCEDYLSIMQKAVQKYGIRLPDRQLACAPLSSPEADRYFGAMAAAANYAWCNRQVLMHLARESIAKVIGRSRQSLGMQLVYDVAHNIAKKETYVINGKKMQVCVHRKGATRALGPGNPLLPDTYRSLGQPVIIPGDMGTASYLLLGTKKAEEETFSSTCHGAGRVMSRSQALRTIDVNRLFAELERKDIQVRAAGKKTLVEEAPQVYKNIDDVIDVVTQAGISRKIAKMRPLCVIKG